MLKDQLSILECLADEYPNLFVLEQYLPHKPLKQHIDHDLALAYPALTRHERGALLKSYTSRLMYLRACVEGASRHALDGSVAGVVTAQDAAFAAVRVAGIMASRQAKNVARKAELRAARTHTRLNADTTPAPIAIQPPASATAPSTSAAKPWPVLRLPAFRRETA